MEKIFSYSSCREVIESHLQLMAQQKGRPERKLTMNNIKIGKEFEPLEFTFTEEDRDRYVWANDDYKPWYMEDSPWGGCIGTPTCLAMQTLMQTYGHYGVQQKGINPPGAVVHAKHEYEFINPLKVGKKLRMTGKPVEKYSRRGRNWIVTEHLVVDEDGKEIVRMKVTNGWPIVPHPEEKTS